MKIKTKLLLIAGFFTLAVVLLGIFFYLSFQSFNLTLEKNKIANQIVTGTFERKLLLDEYLFYHEDRPKDQWFTKNDSMANLIKSESAIFSKESEKEIINNLLKGVDESRKIFSQFLAIREETDKNTVDTGTIKKEQETRLVAQLLIKSQETISVTNQLERTSQQDATVAQKAVTHLLVGFIVVLILIVVLVILFLWRSIVGPITKLHRGTEIIGEGNLEYKVEAKSKDEIGQLGRAFNSMTEKLRLKAEALAVTAEEKEDVRLKLVETNDKLARAEKLAVIGKLAGIMGHEIRNPLGVIRNSIYFLNMKFKESIDEKVRRHMDILESEIDSCDKIISDVLGFARTKPPALTETEINSVVEAAISRANIPKTVKVQTNVGETLTKVKVDILQIGQVFSNLISNAIEAMPNGGELQVTTSQTDTFISITFKDTGVGISKENISKLFEPLFSTKAKGLGLGLAACKNIISAHQGKIKFESKEGQGTTFTVTLPLAAHKNL